MSKKIAQHAIVIGGSMAGLMAARVLSDHFERVTLVERDKMNDAPESRKGQPHTRHLHGLLAKGLEVMTHYFPDLPAELEAGGAIFGDMGLNMRWYAFGGYRVQFDSGLNAATMSRPFLEWHIRQRVVALPNVTVLDECSVEELTTTADRQQVTGVRLTHRGEGKREEVLNADLVVDASGRGSPTPKWLEALGYARPEEEVIKVNMCYSTRIYRRQPGDLVGSKLIMIAPEPPHNKRIGLLFQIEEDRWIAMLGGMAGDYAPTDEQGFLEYAAGLAAPDIYQMLSRLEPLTDIYQYKYPSSLRRRYEKLARFPERYLVMGDAICSFNPIYGQGMTSAAMQAAELDRLIQEQGAKGLHGLARHFFRRAAKVVDIPWQVAAGEDFRFPETEGKKSRETDFINAYVAKVHRATHTDTVVYRAFLDVMNLIQPPSSLMRPSIMWRVLRHRQPKQAAWDTQPQPVR
jgi:2-polyprenyl-6-methoxyphenol hydroxylase-like FAD-dependent oxidoreductase